MRTEPLVLLDQPDDEMCEEHGWIEATVSPDAARDLLIPFVYDEDGKSARPVGEARRVWLRACYPCHPDEQRWFACEPTDLGAREFFAFDVTDCEAVLSQADPLGRSPSDPEAAA
jgi:hypothetical protein